MLLHLDIETLGTNDESLIEVKPPGTMKKAETIAKWEAEEKPQAIKEALAKTGLDGLYGSICVVAWAWDDGPVSHESVSVADEKTVLEFFFEEIMQETSIPLQGRSIDSSLVVVGHNIVNFDLRFILHRAIIHGVKPPPALMKCIQAKPWDNAIADTMNMWHPVNKVSLDKLCKALGIQGKGDMDGSMVAEVWPTDPQKVIDYCRGDVERVRQVYKRLTFQ